jgi:NitT/TauT family transport system substrate-binding protein
MTRSGTFRRAGLALALVAAAALLLALVGPAASSPTKTHRKLATITLDGLPIANGFPLDIGIQQGFFAKRGIEIKKTVFQSGNDIVLAMANHNGDIGYIGWVPAIIARSQGIPVVTVSASDNEATSIDDNWQNVLVKGNSSIRTPKDLEGKTVAGNALKGVCEIVIRAALSKHNVNQDAVKFVAIPFPAMRAALNSGQVDAICAPEPFMTQGLTLDGDRILIAPGPTLGKYWPNGTYVALQDWVQKNPALAKGFHDAMAESLAYAQAHPEAVRAMLPAATRNIRLPVWSSLIDRRQLVQLAKYAKQFGAISTLPNIAALVPAAISTGLVLQGNVGPNTISMKLDGKPLKTLLAGDYTFVVSDRSATQNFHLKGPGLNKSTGKKQVGRLSFTTKLAKGKYTYSSDAKPSLRGSFTVG